MEYRVLLATQGNPHRDFLASVLALTIDFAQNGRPGDLHQLFMSIQRGSILPQLRHYAVRKAQKLRATHILFADSDQDFPANSLRRLLSHNLRVVGANVATKSVPSRPTARGKEGKPIDSRGKSGIEEVWRLGFGLTLIDMSVFADIKPPWFEVIYRPEVDNYVGEDWYFMEKLEKHGIPIYVDHDLSNEVGHWGEMRYTIPMTEVE